LRNRGPRLPNTSVWLPQPFLATPPNPNPSSSQALSRVTPSEVLDVPTNP